MSKLSLDALKERANSVVNEDVMQQIEGGSLFDCHGYWGGVGKKVRDIVVDRALEELKKI